MKRLIGILCQFAGLGTMVWGAFSMLHTNHKPRRNMLDEMYFEYNMDLAILLFLGSIACGSILLWLGSRLKPKDGANQKKH